MVSKVLKLVALVGAGASLYLMTGDNSNCKNYIKKRNKILKNKNNLSIMKEGLNRIYSVNAEYADDLKEHVKEIDEELILDLYDNFKEPVLNNSYLYVDINLIESDLNCSELTYPFDFNDSKYSLLNVINMIENS